MEDELILGEIDWPDGDDWEDAEVWLGDVDGVELNGN